MKTIESLISGISGIEKSDLDELRTKMKPNYKPHNLIDIVELFIDAPHIHDMFREVSLHYQSTTLSYDQINTYMLANLAKNNEESLYGRKIKLENKSKRLRLREPESEDGVKVCFLKNVGAKEEEK